MEEGRCQTAGGHTHTVPPLADWMRRARDSGLHTLASSGAAPPPLTSCGCSERKAKLMSRRVRLRDGPAWGGQAGQGGRTGALQGLQQGLGPRGRPAAAARPCHALLPTRGVVPHPTPPDHHRTAPAGREERIQRLLSQAVDAAGRIPRPSRLRQQIELPLHRRQRQQGRGRTPGSALARHSQPSPGFNSRPAGP